MDPSDPKETFNVFRTFLTARTESLALARPEPLLA